MLNESTFLLLILIRICRKIYELPQVISLLKICLQINFWMEKFIDQINLINK